MKRVLEQIGLFLATNCVGCVRNHSKYQRTVRDFETEKFVGCSTKSSITQYMPHVLKKGISQSICNNCSNCR